MKRVKSVLLGAVMVSAFGCAGGGIPPQYQYTATGAAIGGAAGALLGHQIDDSSGALVGGAAGAVIGGAIGNNMDRQRYGYQNGYSSYGNSATYPYNGQGYPPANNPY